MLAYAYRAMDARGAVRAGSVTARSRAAAIDRLSREGLIPLHVQQDGTNPSLVPPTTAPTSVFSLRSRLGQQRADLSRRELVALTASIAALLNAGLTVERALQIAVAASDDRAAYAFITELLKSVRAGNTLSAAFAKTGRKLPPYFISMVEAGETGGALPEALSRLTALMQRQLEIAERVRSALVYPAMLAGIVLVTLVILLMFVLPRFEALFADADAPLPWSTHAVLALGRFAGSYWWLMFLCTAVSIAAFISWVRTPAGRVHFDHWLLRTRLTFGLPAAVATARLLRMLSTLCGNGVSLPVALRIARGTVVNRRMQLELQDVTAAVQAGGAFSDALARSRLFPPVAVQMAKVGEETGRLHELLQSAARVLEDDSHIRLERLLGLMVPLLTVLMGLIVAGLIGAVLMGLLSINDLAY